MYLPLRMILSRYSSFSLGNVLGSASYAVCHTRPKRPFRMETNRLPAPCGSLIQSVVSMLRCSSDSTSVNSFIIWLYSARLIGAFMVVLYSIVSAAARGMRVLNIPRGAYGLRLRPGQERVWNPWKKNNYRGYSCQWNFNRGLIYWGLQPPPTSLRSVISIDCSQLLHFDIFRHGSDRAVFKANQIILRARIAAL